ncbi:A-kinase anchor protein 12 [Rhynchocyon petersi]
MGAGSSSEQRSPEAPEAGSAPLAQPEPEPSGGGPAEEAAPGVQEGPAEDPATKLLQKNGQLSTVSGSAEQGEQSGQEGDLSGQEGAVVVTDVGQRESEDVTGKDPSREMAANSEVDQDIAKDGLEEPPETLEPCPSDNNVDELAQPAESQSNDVGFKKVFKFVGFKFTVKKDKSEKSDAVQLLTVTKEDAEGASSAQGAGDHREPADKQEGPGAQQQEPGAQQQEPGAEAGEAGEAAPGASDPEPGRADAAPGGREPADGGGEEDAEKREKEAASRRAESPCSPTTEAASPFKKFFSHGWAGWRKKTSFRKPKEDEPEVTEKRKEPEPLGAEVGGLTQDGPAPHARQPPAPEEAQSAGGARLSAEYEKIELPEDAGAPEEKARPSEEEARPSEEEARPSEEEARPSEEEARPSEEKTAPLATEVFDDKVEIIAEVHVRAEKAEEPAAALPEASGETDAQDAQAAREPASTPEDPNAPSGPEARPASTHPEAIVSEVDALSAQERAKVQGSPLKKLFTSTGLKKLSGKKQKGKRGGEDEAGEHGGAPAESPDSAEEQKGESSASSPDEPEEMACLDKGLTDAQQDGEVEEGATSDGEKKREGVTPWASFKKMVTPKKRVRRPSESDKEDEPEKTKSATLSSTESAASEMQEEGKGTTEEPKPEEPKRKVDTSVSWEALICVGSSKKRARRGSSSDEEGAPKVMGGDSQKPDEAGKDKDTGAEAGPVHPQEHDPGQGSSSPEQAGSPSEGEGVSTWESFKRLVTSRKKSKAKAEEKNEDSVTGPAIEHSVSDVEPGKEESWVSIKKFIPGRRKKRLDGKQEQATAEDTGPSEVNEEDSDVPAVVPLAEYDAVEQEKMEAQQAQKSEEKPETEVAVHASEELRKSLVQTVVDGTRAVTNVEERSPSWISASVTEPLETVEDEVKPTEKVPEREIASEGVPTIANTLPESKDASNDTVASEVELTSEAVTAAETTEAFCAEEVTEASGAEETTEMVSAVSQLTDSRDTTEEATPVQEAEGDVPDLEDLGRRTQEVLQAVAEKVKGESQLPYSSGPEDTVQATQKVDSEVAEKVEEAEDSKGLEGFEKVPESVESSDLVSPFPTEALVRVKSQEMPMEQTVTPDSAETLTDSETNGSTPVTELEAPNAAQPDKIKEGHEEGGAAPCIQPEMPSSPSSVQSHEENEEPLKMEEVLEHTVKELPVETPPILSKTEVIDETDQSLDEKTKDIPFAEGLEVSTDTDVIVSQKIVTEVATEFTEKAEFQETVAYSDSIGLQSCAESSPTPEESETVVEVEREKTEDQPTQINEEKLEQKLTRTVPELSKPPAQTINVTVVDGENEVTTFEEPACLVQEEAVSREIEVQSSAASLPLTVASVEEKVVGETVKVFETAAEALESADAHLVPEGQSSDKDNCSPQPGEDAVSRGNEALVTATSVMESVPAAEKEAGSDVEGDEAPQKAKSHEDNEQAAGQIVEGSVTGGENAKMGSAILEIESESSKLVQNVVQTAVDQLVGAAASDVPTDSEAPAQAIVADDQEAGEKSNKEESEFQASALGETHAKAAMKEEPEPATTSQDGSEATREMVTTELECSSADDQQQLEALTLPSEEAREASRTKSAPEDDNRAALGEGTEKSPCESRGAEKGDSVDNRESQHATREDTDASGDLTKESPDTNGPKLKKKDDAQEVEFQEGKVHSESEKEIKTSPPEEMHTQERGPAQSEPTESSNAG